MWSLQRIVLAYLPYHAFFIYINAFIDYVRICVLNNGIHVHVVFCVESLLEEASLRNHVFTVFLSLPLCFTQLVYSVF